MGLAQGAGTMTTKTKSVWAAPLALAGALALGGGCATADSGDGEEAHVYRIHEIVLPQSFEDVRRVAFDLDGDGRLDNAAGATLMSFFMNFDGSAEALATLANQALADRRVDWFVELDRDPHEGPAQVISIRGAIDADSIDALPATLLADVVGDWPVTWIEASTVAGEVAIEGGWLKGRIGFALPADALPVVVEPMARYFTDKLQAGELEMSALMDADRDGTITSEEFLDFELVKTMLQPDVDVLGDDNLLESWSGALGVVARPIHDGAADAVID